MPGPAPASRPTLRKCGADLRWLLEKSGINPETAIVTIGVANEVERSLLISTFLKEFESGCMQQHRATHLLTVLGVQMAVVTIPKPVPKEAA